MVDADEPQSFQRLADALQVIGAPEGQQRQQIGVADMQPGQSLAAGCRLMQVKTFYLLQKNGFLKTHGRCKLGREH